MSAGNYYQNRLGIRRVIARLAAPQSNACVSSNMLNRWAFTLNEVKQLLALRITPGCTCTDVRYRAQTKMEDIQRKISSLHAMKRALQRLASACTADGPASECSFLANLNNEEMR
jgi:MerR, DNA binding